MSNDFKTFKDYCINEVRDNGENVRRYANSDNPVLRALAIEVLGAAGAQHAK